MSNLSILLASIPKPFDFSDIFRNIRTRWYVYVVVAVALLVILCFVLLKKRQRNTLTSTQKLVYTAIMTTICFLANYLTIQVSELLQISFLATAGFVSGYLLGSGCGFVCAFLGDFLCGIIRPLGVYSPIIGLGSGLMGFIPGVIFERINLNDYFLTAMSYIATFIVASLFVNTFGLCLLYGFPMDIYLARLPITLLSIAINLCVCILLVSIFKKVLPKDKFGRIIKEK